MDISEPKISSEEVLILVDDDFNTGNTCIVTGAANGIGRATAVAAAANGLMTVGLDVDEDEGKRTQEMAAELGGEMVFIPTDLTREQDMKAAVDEAAKLGRIRYLANVAGIQHVAPIHQFPLDSFDRMQGIMLRAPFYLSKLVVGHMKADASQSGVVGNMASVHAHICTKNKVAYNIAKFGLRALSQSISAEGEGKIRSFSVSTGYVKTGLVLSQIPSQAEQRGISQSEVVQDVMMGTSLVKDMMAPIDVANLFIFGFSRYSRYLVGGDLLFDGGMVLTY